MLSVVRRAGAMVYGLAAAALCLFAQNTLPPAARANEPGALPPRSAPSDYPSQAQAGAITIAAEFKGHFVPTLDGTLTTEDYIVVEAALFGAPGAKIRLSVDDFSLRVNNKKNPLASQPYGAVAASLTDPDWEPPTPPESKNKTSFGGGGGGGGQNDPPPPPPRPPVETRRAWLARTAKVSMAEGERPLPQAGLIFFPYRGQSKGIDSLELIYKGPAGRVTLDLQP
ncbi:MAG TPA: hypothetical protein VKV74_03710 [Bryobacteraceae bacterium]|nr:hypothetical protein [Bryobacteraceae bacterium]